MTGSVFAEDGQAGGCSSADPTQVEHVINDDAAFARFTPDERLNFFQERTKTPGRRWKTQSEGASLFAAGVRSASENRAEQCRFARQIMATPLRLVDPNHIPRRQWIYGRHFARNFVSATVAPGGVGKSSLLIAEALAISTGCALLGIQPDEQTNVWIWNGEDPMEEMVRRVSAAAKHYGIHAADLSGKLYVNSGRSTPISIAEQVSRGAEAVRPVIDQIVRTIKGNNIGLLIVDPFVASHRVSENDNNAIEVVVSAWAQIAEETGACIELVHHSRKNGGGETTVDDARGASALLAKARSVRVLNSMSAADAGKAGLENRRLYFRCENGKSNMTVPADKATWYRLASIDLGNGSTETEGCGDSVGVVVGWNWPAASAAMSADELQKLRPLIEAGRCRAYPAACDWVGYAVGEVLGLLAANTTDNKRIKAVINACLANGTFERFVGKDKKGNERPIIRIAEAAICSTSPPTISSGSASPPHPTPY